MQPSNNNHYRDLSLLAWVLLLVIFFLHCYFFCYGAFAQWGLTSTLMDRFTGNLAHTGLFRNRVSSKLIALLCLALTFIGSRPKGSIPKRRRLIKTLIAGALLYFGSDLILQLTAEPQLLASGYILLTLSGLFLLHTSAGIIAGLLLARLSGDIFNRFNESFPQEERLVTNDYSINLKARYTYRGQVRNSYINLVDIFRGTLVMGTPGSGKTRYIFREAIRQSLEKNMAVFVYDLKYDDLTRFTYNAFLNSQNPQFAPGRAATPKKSFHRFTFYSINFDDLSRSHRCNPLDPADLVDISDAAESARTILLALNKKWIHQQGDFFVESAVNFFTANIWFLRLYEDGRYCTLPHLIELIQTDYNKLFSILQSYSSITTFINSFISAYQSNTMEQLQGQIDSARIPLSALASPQLYYLLSANDFKMDLNNPDHPKVICIGSNPQKQHVYGAIISLYVSRMLKLVNRKGGIPSDLFFDEFASFYAASMDFTLANARSNKVAVTLGIQDLSQLRKEYGRDHADALFNLPGNLISGQVTGDSARLVSERFGKILQEKTSVSTNSRDSSTSQSFQLDLAVPASKISTLSSGEFVGVMADSPDQPIQLKSFHCRILADAALLAKEDATAVPIPEIRVVDRALIESNFQQIKEDIRRLVATRLNYMQNTPGLAQLIVKKPDGLSRKRPFHD